MTNKDRIRNRSMAKLARRRPGTRRWRILQAKLGAAVEAVTPIVEAVEEVVETVQEAPKKKKKGLFRKN